MPYSPTLGPRPEDLNPNIFSATAGGFLTAQQVSTIYDRPIPEQMWALERHVDYTGFQDWLRFMGYRKGTSNPTTGHYEWPWKDDTVKFSSVVTAATGAGADIVLALHSDNMYDTVVTANGSSVKSSYIQKGMVIEFPNRVQAYVKSKDISTDPHRVTLRPLDSTVNLNSVVAVNTEYFIATNYWEEGGGMPDTIVPRIVKYSNSFGICKSAWSGTGTEATNKVYFEPVPGRQGSIYLRVDKDLMYYHSKARDGMLLFGKQANNINVYNVSLEIDVPISGTEGFVSFASTSGTVKTYTSGSYSLNDIDTVAQILEDERATMSSNIICWTGTEAHQERENALANILSNNLDPFINRMIPALRGYDFSAIADTDESFDFSYTFGIYAVRKGGFNFVFKKMPAFNDIKGAGLSNYKYRGTSIYHPVGTQIDREGREIPLVGYEYKELDGYSRDLVPSKIVGAGTNIMFGTLYAANEYDSFKIGLLSEIAGHFACGNKIVFEEPA